MPGTFSVLARRPLSLRTAIHKRQYFGAFLIYNNPTPLGPYNLWAEHGKQIDAEFFNISGNMPAVCTAIGMKIDARLFSDLAYFH